MLVFTDCLNKAYSVSRSADTLKTICKVYKYRCSAALSIAIIVRTMLCQELDKGLQDDVDGLDIPLFSYNSNTKIVIEALTRATEALIQLQSPPTTLNFYDPTYAVDLTFGHDSQEYIRSLVRSLIALKKTIFGSFAACKALDYLMQHYSDTIFQCWLAGSDLFDNDSFRVELE